MSSPSPASPHCYYHRRFGAQALLHAISRYRKTKTNIGNDGTRVHESSYRLFVTDRKTGLSFLVNTGVNISILPRSKSCRSSPLPFKLFAATNTEISTYGEETLELDLNLRRPYKWKFIVANVSKVGADNSWSRLPEAS
ncbi:hypothetical protein ACJJTC_008825 [Scirpophaga incertulas]